MSISTETQKEYYERTATDYDAMHLREPEHEFALSQLLGIMRYHGYDSMLDIGSGTGRVLRHSKPYLPGVRFAGIEPVAGLREIGYLQGLTSEELFDGDAMKLNLADDSWDIVCAFGILHHIPDPSTAIREMCRVAKHGIFFSDLNNYGCGPLAQRIFAHSMRIMHLWKPFQYIKNGFKYEKYSVGDGIHYSYSLFDSLDVIAEKFPQIHICNTKGTSKHPFFSCSHVSVFGVRDSESLSQSSLAASGKHEIAE